MSTMTFIIIATTLLTLLPSVEMYRNRKWVEFSLTIFFGLMLLILQTCKDTQDESLQKEKDNKIDTLKNELKISNERCSSANYLSRLNLELGGKIETLSKLNISIDSNTQDLVSRSTNLLERNIQLTEALPPLTQNVKNLVKKVGDEVTGGYSIPLVSCILLCDSIPENFDIYHASKTGLRIPTGKWLVILKLKNTGSNKITDLSITRYRRGRRDRGRIEEKISCPEVLVPSDSILLETKEISNILPQSKDDKSQIYVIDEADGFGLVYRVKVKWRNSNYIFNYTVKQGQTILLETSYEFREKLYFNEAAFLSNIFNYLYNQWNGNGY